MRGNPISIDEVTAVPRVTVLEKALGGGKVKIW